MKRSPLLCALATVSLALAACGDDGSGNDRADVGGDAGEDTRVDTTVGASDDAAGDTSDATQDPGGDVAPGIDAEQDTSPPPDPAEPGPYNIGFRTVDITYQRDDDGTERSLYVALWYPTDEGPPEPIRYQGLYISAPVVEDAAPALDGPAPILLFSHGNTLYAEASAFLAEHFASHGWLVASPSHTGNTIRDLGTPRDTAIYHLRATDLSAILDWLDELGGDDPIGAMASDRVIASGHSFGGYTTMTLIGAGWSDERMDGCEDDPPPGDEFCSTWSETHRAIFEAGRRDERILAGITMAGGNFGELGAGGVAQVEAPLLQITGGLDMDVTNEANGDPIFAALPGDVIRVDLPRACHGAWSVGCGGGNQLPSEDGWRISRAYALAFAAREALGETGYDGILDGSEPIDADEVVLTIK